MQPPGALLTPGDKAPNFSLPDQGATQRVFSLEVKGGPIVLFAFSALQEPEQEAALAELAALGGEFGEIGAEIYAVGASDPQYLANTTERLGLSFSLFADLQGQVLPQLLAAAPPAFPETKSFQPRYATYVLDPNQRVLAAFRREKAAEQPRKALTFLRQWGANPRPKQVLGQSAPVLMLPGVLEPELCQSLIELWHTGGHQEGSVSTGSQNVYSPDAKKNREHLIQDPELSQRISFALARRIGPEITKAFNYKAPFRFEAHIVLCYEDQRQDFFGLHRDNLRPTSPRRFAASTNLNEGYEGGELYFPEYGPHGYCPPAGGSCVFSCELLHEARPVTRGRRFVMTSFFCEADKPREDIPPERRRQMRV